jgi:hypothetical protein
MGKGAIPAQLAEVPRVVGGLHVQSMEATNGAYQVII